MGAEEVDFGPHGAQNEIDFGKVVNDAGPNGINFVAEHGGHMAVLGPMAVGKVAIGFAAPE